MVRNAQMYAKNVSLHTLQNTVIDTKLLYRMGTQNLKSKHNNKKLYTCYASKTKWTVYDKRMEKNEMNLQVLEEM